MTENANQRTLSARLYAAEGIPHERKRTERAASDVARNWRRRFVVCFVALIAVSAIGAAAITSTTNSFEGLKGDVYEYDESTLAIVSQGMSLQASTLAAAGDSSGSAVEMDASLGAANTALASGDWYYKIDVEEAAIDSVPSGSFKVELFVGETSKGALYMTQGTASATDIEGVSFKWSLGSSLNANAAYVVKVTSA